MAIHDQHSDVLSSGAGLAADISVETKGQLGFDPGSPADGGGSGGVKARGYWEGVWLRFSRDKLAIAGFITVALMLLLAFAGAPIFAHFLGHGPNDILTDAITDAAPKGPLFHAHNYNGTGTTLILGASDTLGRDELLRLLYGARVSFEVAIIATIIGVGIGVLLGAMAGYFKGWIDIVISRVTEITMAFPVLLFAIALATTVGQRLNNITFGIFAPGVVSLVLVISTFSWYYPARIIRGLVLSLREKEFIEAARMVGSSDWRIIRSHLLPHLVAPIIVYSTLTVAVNVLFEASLSFLGLGIQLPTASWGSLLSTAPSYYQTNVWIMVFPGLAVAISVLAFNLLGDGLRDAFDPRSAR